MVAPASLNKILGGRGSLGKKVSSLGDLDKLVREGIPWASAAHAKAQLGLSDKKFAELLGASPSTLARVKKKQARLSLVASDRLVRLADVVSQAIDTLENQEAAIRWLNSPQRGLGWQIPMELIQTEAGASQVQTLLGQIEYSVLT